jgi:uncharacterized protein
MVRARPRGLPSVVVSAGDHVKKDGHDVRVLQSVRLIGAAAWQTLLGPDVSPFVDYTWLDTLEQTGCVGGDSGWQPAHLTLWQGAQLVAACPSYVKANSEGEFVFDWGWADAAERAGIAYYPKIVVAVPFTPATGRRVLTLPGADRDYSLRLMAAAARRWCSAISASSVHVLFPPRDEAKAWEDAGFLRRDGFQFHWFREDTRTFDEYLTRFSSKQRNQIKREIRSVQDAGIRVRTLMPAEHTGEMARVLHRFYATTIAKHGIWGRMYLSAKFFERIFECYGDHLACVIATDKATGQIVAGAFNVVHGSRLYGRYWGATRDVPCLHFVVCYYEGIRFAIERGLDVFEPGAGGEHKRARGFVPTMTHSAHWIADGRFGSALASWLARERDRVAEIVGGAGDAD